MRNRLITLAVAAGAATMLLGPAVATASNGENGRGRGSLTAIGLVDGTQLVRFDTHKPKKVHSLGQVTGLQSDTALVGIDFRVQDGNLYGVGNSGGIYLLDTGTAAAAFVQRLTVPLDGSEFGVDFNPAANALRIVSNTGQNLRQPFATANAPTAVDVRLTAPPAAGDVAGVSAAAYTNNDLDPSTATTLFDINTAADAVAIQSPANAGTLAATGSLTVDADAAAGFDIYSTVRNGIAVKQHAFATLGVNGGRALYRIDLLTGRATSVGWLGQNVSDLAFPLGQL